MTAAEKTESVPGSKMIKGKGQHLTDSKNKIQQSNTKILNNTNTTAEWWAAPDFSDAVHDVLIKRFKGNYECSLCNLKFDTKDKILLHVALKHRNQLKPKGDAKLDDHGLYLLGFLSGFQNASTIQKNRPDKKESPESTESTKDDEKVNQLLDEIERLNKLIETLQDELQCAKCKNNKRRTVAFQCGHLSYCSDCGKVENTCAVCGAKKVQPTTFESPPIKLSLDSLKLCEEQPTIRTIVKPPHSNVHNHTDPLSHSQSSSPIHTGKRTPIYPGSFPPHNVRRSISQPLLCFKSSVTPITPKTPSYNPLGSSAQRSYSQRAYIEPRNRSPVRPSLTPELPHCRVICIQTPEYPFPTTPTPLSNTKEEISYQPISNRSVNKSFGSTQTVETRPRSRESTTETKTRSIRSHFRRQPLKTQTNQESRSLSPLRVSSPITPIPRTHNVPNPNPPLVSQSLGRSISPISVITICQAPFTKPIKLLCTQSPTMIPGTPVRTILKGYGPHSNRLEYRPPSQPSIQIPPLRFRSTSPILRPSIQSIESLSKKRDVSDSPSLPVSTPERKNGATPRNSPSHISSVPSSNVVKQVGFCDNPTYLRPPSYVRPPQNLHYTGESENDSNWSTPKYPIIRSGSQTAMPYHHNHIMSPEIESMIPFKYIPEPNSIGWLRIGNFTSPVPRNNGIPSNIPTYQHPTEQYFNRQKQNGYRPPPRVQWPLIDMKSNIRWRSNSLTRSHRSSNGH